MNAYLLVGGHSRRMGRSKSELFLGRVTAAARLVFDELIAVQRHGADPAPGVETIFEDQHIDEAPAFGVLAALRHARRRCFILAVDYPLITADVLRFIENRSNAPLVVPRWAGTFQTLCAVYEAPVIEPLLTTRVAMRTYDLHGLLGLVETEIIGEPELRSRFAGEPLANINTPEELEGIRR